tara:strand:+ start:19849 stop:20022 length:174 start_codon:yes stop_codon:yes gene_type:complete
VGTTGAFQKQDTGFTRQGGNGAENYRFPAQIRLFLPAPRRFSWGNAHFVHDLRINIF